MIPLAPLSLPLLLAVGSPASPFGGGPTLVLEREGVEYAYPHLSRDGKSILLQSNESGSWRICTVPVTGGEPVPITPESSDCYFPDWSPGNDRICFVSDDTGSEEIWIMDADGSDRRQITENGARNIHPYWSPDGGTILFSSTMDGGDLDVYRIRPDGTHLEPVLRTPNHETCARLSPDGKSVVLLMNNGAGTLDDIFLLHLGDPAPVNLTKSPVRDGWPCWTPDGSRVVFSEVENGVFKLFALDPESGSRERLTDPGSADDCRPNVSADGRFVVFNRERSTLAGKTNAVLILEL